MTESRHAAVIIGCGYLGERLAPLLPCAVDDRLLVVRSERHAARLASAGLGRVMRCDLVFDDPSSFIDELTDAMEVYFMVPPSPLGDTAAERVGALAARLARAAPRVATLVSSTSVYGAVTGEVDADTLPQPDSPRAQRVYDIEQAWRAAGPTFRIVRLAGIYGPQRVIGRTALAAEESLPGQPDQPLNLVHVDDAARLLIAAHAAATTATVELGCDGHPVLRRDYYGWLAERMGVAPPTFEPSRAARGGGRTCSNAVTCRRTGWMPAYADFRAGIEASIDARGSR